MRHRILGLVALSISATLLALCPTTTAVAQPARTSVTYADLVAMFGDRVGDRKTVETGLPTLNRAMSDARITTPYRQAAYLTTLAHESSFHHDAKGRDKRKYAGRGYIQLTGEANYTDAGAYLGIDLRRRPELARSLDHSAPISRWYWTVARDINPLADVLDMGAVNAAIGYPYNKEEDTERCRDFKAALKHLNGSVPKGIDCTRPKKASSQDRTPDAS
ncbi:glycoside hydrolase family 19 protein [Nocardioides sp. NPDC101246]|uniref:glycoside hydrolase family 19 protein n=1 Tax=Nocardioides sp. NPDC101246 TaxID=3364336 RepID=UPI003803D92E